MQQLVWFDSGVNSCQGQSQACLHTWLPQEEKHLYSIRRTLFLGKIWLEQNKQSVIEKYTKEEKRQQEKKKVSESFKRDKSRENKLKGKFEYCKKNQRNYKPKNPTQYFQFQLYRKFMLVKKLLKCLHLQLIVNCQLKPFQLVKVASVA